MTRRHIAMLAAAYVGLGVAYGVGTWWLIVRTRRAFSSQTRAAAPAPRRGLFSPRLALSVACSGSAGGFLRI